MDCLLCHSASSPFESTTFLCEHCGLIFKNPSLHLNTTEEKKRYSLHQNNEVDQGYIDFLNNLIFPLQQFLPDHFSALDFGSGPTSTIATLLEKLGGTVESYDPYFLPIADLINKNYDVVTSTEVVEHFKTPSTDWELLIGRVKKNGLLGIMTQFFDPSIDFKSWWYKNDSTHVVFYQRKTFEYLKEKHNLEIIYSDKKAVIIFRKK